jgi:hypothetical protein
VHLAAIIGANIVVGIDFAAQIFPQGLGDGIGNIQINTFQQRVTAAVGIVATRRHDKAPDR